MLLIDKHDQTIGQKIEQPKWPRFKGEAGSWKQNSITLTVTAATKVTHKTWNTVSRNS